MTIRDGCDGILLLCKIPSQSTQPTRDGDNDENVQISQELFVALLHYHLSGENEYEEVIEQGLEQKLDAMLRHELYAQYKTAPTEEQREQARQEYLDRRGVPESFRW